ncbi:MAG: acyloxyacyl hydrolase [Acidobacteriaceae bacterium]
MASYGNWTPFGTSLGVYLYTTGVEYDRHSWGHLLGAQVDYVAEVLPVVVLSEAKTTTLWGTPTTTERQTIPGIGISPFGWRMMWRTNRRWKPYWIAKMGMLAFTQKALSREATYENFFPQSGVGVQVSVSPRMDLRLGLFNYEHFSNADLVRVNPGVDLMTSSFGISYHLGRQGQPEAR